MSARTQPAPWLRPVNTGVPALARDIVDAILDDIPDYRVIATPALRAHALRIVKKGLYTLLGRVTSPLAPRLDGSPHDLVETFREVGRREARAGRPHDVLQAAYRVASRVLVHRMLDWERQFSIPINREFTDVAFQFLDDLAEHSARGYLEALGEGPSLDRERTRLLALLLELRHEVSDEVSSRAERVRWTLPKTATLIALIGLPDGHADPGVARFARDVLGPDVLAGRFGGHDLVLVPGRPSAETLTNQLRTVRPELGVIVGFPVPVAQLGFSLHWLRRLARVCDPIGAGPTVATCESSVLRLLDDAAGDLCDWLVEVRLRPLLELTPSKRLKLGRLLSAWLELGGVKGEVPGVLDKHRQTLRYQLARVDQLFGADLADRNARLELMIALRRALPEWERQHAGGR